MDCACHGHYPLDPIMAAVQALRVSAITAARAGHCDVAAAVTGRSTVWAQGPVVVVNLVPALRRPPPSAIAAAQAMPSPPGRDRPSGAIRRDRSEFTAALVTVTA